MGRAYPPFARFIFYWILATVWQPIGNQYFDLLSITMDNRPIFDDK